MTTGREHGRHALQGGTGPRRLAPGDVWDDTTMTGSFLVARLHVDLQRTSSAVCSR